MSAWQGDPEPLGEAVHGEAAYAAVSLAFVRWDVGRAVGGGTALLPQQRGAAAHLVVGTPSGFSHLHTLSLAVAPLLPFAAGVPREGPPAADMEPEDWVDDRASGLGLARAVAAAAAPGPVRASHPQPPASC